MEGAVEGPSDDVPCELWSMVSMDRVGIAWRPRRVPDYGKAEKEPLMLVLEGETVEEGRKGASSCGVKSDPYHAALNTRSQN